MDWESCSIQLKEGGYFLKKVFFELTLLRTKNIKEYMDNNLKKKEISVDYKTQKRCVANFRFLLSFFSYVFGFQL